MVLVAVIAALVASIAGTALAASEPAPVGAPANATAASLSAHVTRHLVTLREEEKLARDVYTALHNKRGVEAFGKVATVEARHVAAVKSLLDKYGIEDPVGGNPPGVFTSEKIQTAYNDALAKGTTSLDDAYKVGIAIEKAEIALLRDLMGDTFRRDIKLVALNLLGGSLNHLAAFNTLLNK
jgi:hypothetical protein